MGNNPINQVDPDGGFSGTDPKPLTGIGHQSLVGEFNFDMAMANVAPNLFYGISSIRLCFQMF